MVWSKIGRAVQQECRDRDLHSFPTRRSSDLNNLIQRNQSAAFSSGKVRPNHETNINIIARRTGKDVNSHTVLDGIITTIMATIPVRRAIMFMLVSWFGLRSEERFSRNAETEIYTLSLHDALPILIT